MRQYALAQIQTSYQGHDAPEQGALRFEYSRCPAPVRKDPAATAATIASYVERLTPLCDRLAVLSYGDRQLVLLSVFQGEKAGPFVLNTNRFALESKALYSREIPVRERTLRHVMLEHGGGGKPYENTRSVIRLMVVNTVGGDPTKDEVNEFDDKLIEAMHHLTDRGKATLVFCRILVY